jgi:hypothetical protein
MRTCEPFRKEWPPRGFLFLGPNRRIFLRSLEVECVALLEAVAKKKFEVTLARVSAKPHGRAKEGRNWCSIR